MKKLTIEEPLPGAFVWRLLETDAQGASPRILRSAYDASENYETALSAGQRALQSEIRQRTSVKSVKAVKANAGRRGLTLR